MMRLSVSALVVGLVMLGGCSSEQAGSGSLTDKAKPAGQRPAGPIRHSAAMRPPIASLPDNGDLIRYDSVRRIEPSGAYTSYPVSLSEAHALHALSGGDLEVRTPDGERLRLQAQRHEEYPDGNWTLVASDRSGAQSLLTFGQDAVFGSITRADGSVLRVTTRQRQVYLVSVDREQLARLENPGERVRTDMLTPPVRTAAAQSARGTSSGQVQAQAGTNVGIAAANDIDVLLGYTNGLVARIGSESGAVTRMQNLVAIANEAYGNSGITMRLRLVRSMLVNYTDNNTNQSALQSVTGSSGSGSVPIDAAFNALRAAREETGADLVSLVRQFKEPENDGCGIAWLLGGGQTAITQGDASFAYSVVSDGSDVRESDGKTYFCRDETFAHELGHNMGQAHNTEDSTSSGAHAYSYGYREPSSTGFFTVMAYRLTDSSQVGIRYFANPAVSFSGRPTGVANQSDNARSLNLTMPVIAAFRADATRSGRIRDLNGDGRSDLLFQNSNGALSYWLLNANTVIAAGSTTMPSGYTIRATGDYNGDGFGDLILSDGRNMLMWLWRNTGGFGGYGFGFYDVGWQIHSSVDLNGDGRSDLLFQNSNGALSYWLLNANTVIAAGSTTMPSGYTIRATGDYNGDGSGDLILSDGRNMLMWLWRNTGGFGGYGFGFYDVGWQIHSSVDLNGDGRSDLLFQNSSGALSYWLLNANTVIAAGSTTMPSGYTIRATGDYNGDGSGDLILSDGRNMLMWLWRNTGGFGGYGFGFYDAGWTIVGPR